MLPGSVLVKSAKTQGIRTGKLAVAASSAGFAECATPRQWRSHTGIHRHSLRQLIATMASGGLARQGSSDDGAIRS